MCLNRKENTQHCSNKCFYLKEVRQAYNVNVHVMMVLWGQSIIIDFDIDIDVNTDMDISILTLILMLDLVFGRLKIFPWVSLLFPAK